MQKHTPAIMIQGTCSNAGKSLLTAALCRIFAEDGLNPAPFKAQNMALNSFVTDDGREIGRAQALQATACGRAPDSRMNPVLLKPNSDTGSQVIVMGRPVGNMRVKEYLAYKPEAWRAVTRAYDSLAAESGVMVIEGAGSPAEINLKAHDIVNMTMARYANAPVLLTADIDRGGAFASLIGTMALLDEEEQGRVAAFVLNKFRGDASLLDSALAITTERTGKAFLGVVPWLHGLNLPEEDSVSFRLYGFENTTAKASPEDMLDVALLDLPHASNLTDVDALRGEGDVHLRIVREAGQLYTSAGKGPHVLIIPGSKNTPGDLQHLRDSGLAKAILQLCQQKEQPLLLLAICGGLQMLGASIEDPLGLESGTPCTLPGLGLLPLHTELAVQKTLRCVSARHGSGHEAHGYEIHHGVTRTEEQGLPCRSCLHDQEGRPLGWEREEGSLHVFGTYMHGVLDADAFRRHLLDKVRTSLGWKKVETLTPYSVGPGLTKLAAAVRESLDMQAVYRLIGR